ncbi:MAG: HNH endonuclease [Chloroflexi bacterium]|nr:HNH endonuclease [Chloroflexota bacterium]
MRRVSTEEKRLDKACRTLRIPLDFSVGRIVQHQQGRVRVDLGSFYESLRGRTDTQLELALAEFFARDRDACQYCGRESRNLTLDHVKPRFRGGSHSWENVVTACISCNHRKAGRTPKEAGMKLLTPPRAPRPNPYYMFYRRPLQDEWLPFIPWAR